MKYRATVNGKVYEVEIERMTGSARRVSAAGVSASMAEPHAESRPAPETAPPQPPKQALAPAPDTPSGEAVVSPMSGSVLEVRPKVGDSVSAGQTVVVLEAMKMEIEVKTEHAGTVSSICVKKGDTVESGAELLLL